MRNYSLSERIIEKSFYLSVWTIEQFSNTEKLKEKVERLNKFEEGTLGKEIANCLKENNLNLVPNYESHDLKHSLLNFKMTDKFLRIRLKASVKISPDVLIR